MSYNGSGTFLINTAGQPVVSGTVISSTAFNALTADLATGLSTAITKDGQTTVTANIPMSTYKFTGLGVGSAATDSANLSQVQSTVTKLLNSVSGADTITATASPTLAAYAAGQMFYFVAAGDNTTSVTLNIDSLGAKAVTRDGATALAASDIKSGEVVVVVYDGTRFQVVSQLNSAGDARFANVSIASSLYVGGVSTFVGNAGFSANVSIASALSVGGVAAITGATTIGGNLTLSGGTANGVLYLNGSKVATSGSALTFDGTTLGSTGLIVSTNRGQFKGNSTTGFAGGGVEIGYTGTIGIVNSYDRTASAYKDLQLYGADIYNYVKGSNAIWDIAGSGEVMRLNSTGLGIGTASPAQRLHINTATTYQGILINGNQAPSVCFATSTNTTPAWKVGLSGNNSANFAISSGAAATDAVTLDSSGNLGLGVTPSAWSTGKAYETTAAGHALWALSNEINVTQNAYFNAGWKYGATAAAARYQQQSGEHKWHIAASGTAGNAISFTQAMTLDASGNLGIGTASPAARLHVAGASQLVRLQRDDAYIQFANTANTDTAYIQQTASVFNIISQVNGAMIFGTNSTERARITAAGGFSVGTTTDLGAGNIAIAAGKYLGYSSTAYMTPEDNSIGARVSTPGAFTVWTGATPAERMRITAAGNVVAGGSVALATNATDGFLYVPTCAGTPTGTPTAITGMAPIVVNTTNNKLYFYSGGAWRDAGP